MVAVFLRCSVLTDCKPKVCLETLGHCSRLNNVECLRVKGGMIVALLSEILVVCKGSQAVNPDSDSFILSIKE